MPEDRILIRVADNAHRTYVNVKPCDLPKGAIAVEFTTTFTKAKNPDEHRVQHTAHFTSKDELKLFIDHLSKYL